MAGFGCIFFLLDTDQGQLFETQQGEMPGPALGSQQCQAAPQAEGRLAAKIASGKGPGSAG